MRSPAAALLWAVWRRHRASVWTIAGFTVVSWLVHLSERGSRPPGAAPDPSSLVEMLAMFAFLLLVGVFGYLDTDGEKGIGQFPRRLFTLPISSFRLVMVPTLAGIAAVELFYTAWREPLSRGEPTSALFTGVLLAAFMVFFQAVLWTLDRAGALRIVITGAIGILVFGISLLPSFPPAPPPLWRTEGFLAVTVGATAIVVFLVSWRHVARLRSGEVQTARWFELIGDAIAEAWPTRRQPFSSPAAAHFWFEWRGSGAVLPALVFGVIVVAIGPLSWNARNDAGEALRLLLIALVTPIALAVPVGMAASKPAFWSEDLSVPAFTAVRPLSAADIVATKVKVAAVSAALAWIVLLAFVAVWLSLWGNLDVSRIAIRFQAFRGRSVPAVYGVLVLVVTAAMFITWRCLVSRLWTGLSGSRPLFMTSIVSVPLLALGAVVFSASRLPGWLLEDPARMTAFAWILATAVTAKFWLAARSWRRVAPRYVRQYLLVWLAGTTCFVIVVLVLWRTMRTSAALDIDRFQIVVILLPLLVMPLARIGLAPSSLTRNRHR